MVFGPVLKYVKKNLKSPQWLRNIKIKERPFWNFFKDKQPQLIENGGWHFSFLKNPKEIKKKNYFLFSPRIQ